jgi:hypothetical protein
MVAEPAAVKHDNTQSFCADELRGLILFLLGGFANLALQLSLNTHKIQSYNNTHVLVQDHVNESGASKLAYLCYSENLLR